MSDDAVQSTPDLPAAFGPERVIRFFPDHSAEHPLWLTIGDPDLADLRLPEDLAARLRRWSGYWDSTHHWDHGWPVGTPASWWTEEEARLPRDLALAVGPDFVIEADGRYLHSIVAGGSPGTAAALHELVRVDAEERARISTAVAAGARFDVVAGGESYAAWLSARQQSDDADGTDVDDETPDWPRPSAAFTDHFADPLYRDLADEFAPFGTDEGFDAMTELVRLPATTGLTLRGAVEALHGQETVELLDQQDGDDTAEVDPVVIGLAFGLIWLTGTLDRDGADTASAALRRQADRYGRRSTLDTVRHDFASYRARRRSE